MKQEEASFFLPYQRAWIQDRSRLKLMEKSRQIGMTWASAYAAVRQQLLAPGKACWVSSRDEPQARLFLQDCLRFARFMDTAMGIVKGCSLGLDPHAHSLSLGSNGAIHSLSSAPNAQAGKRGTRILDEFALHPDPQTLYNIAFPGITWGGSLEILSTHRGVGNFFNTLVKEIREGGNPKGFSYHRVTLSDALDQGFLKKLQSKLPQEDPRQTMDNDAYFEWIRQGCSDNETFLQEYQCEPINEASALLGYTLITDCEYPKHEAWELKRLSQAKGGLYLGVDLGRDQDLTVFWVLELLGDVLFTRRVQTLHKRTFREQEDVLFGLMNDGFIRRVCIDQTGLGRQFTERAQLRYGPARIQGIHFSASLKEDMAYTLKHTLQERRLRLPNQPEIRNDLRAIKREINAHGTLRLHAPRTQQGHADRFWALALAVHAAQRPYGRSSHYEGLSPPWK